MKFIFASYVYTCAFNSPEAWIDRIKAYTGILEALAKNNTVTSIEQINFEGDYKKDGVQYAFKRYSKTGLRFPFKLHSFIKKQQPDVVVIQSLHYPLQVIQLRLMLGRKTKIIIQNHAEKPFTGIKRHLQKLADKFTDAYLFASYDMGVEWVEKGNLASTKKIYEVMEVSSVFIPADKALAKQQLSITGTPVFLWVGRLNPNKDPLTVINAFLKYALINPAAKLYMIYHTEELLYQVMTAIESSSNKDAITLVGRVPHSELQTWFNAADVILSASHYEGSGTAVCEAMSCGCMPIVTDIFSFRMITDNGSCGYLYEPGDEIALLSILTGLTDADILAKQERSLAFFKENLSFDAIAGKIEKIAKGL